MHFLHLHLRRVEKLSAAQWWQNNFKEKKKNIHEKYYECRGLEQNLFL